MTSFDQARISKKSSDEKNSFDIDCLTRGELFTQNKFSSKRK